MAPRRGYDIKTRGILALALNDTESKGDGGGLGGGAEVSSQRQI